MTKQEIKDDILKLDEQSLLKKYLLNTEVWYFTGHHELDSQSFINQLDIMNDIISTHLLINMKNILIIGSGKTGFSFAPYKALKEFDSDRENDSDIDVAIVSNKYFHEYWSLAREMTSVIMTNSYKKISSGIFRGFISEKTIETIPEIRKIWANKVRNIKKVLVEETCLTHPIKFRIYRSWGDLESYHLKGLKDLKEALLKG